MEITVVEDSFEGEVSHAHVDGQINIDTSDAVKFEIEIRALIRKFQK